MGAQAERLNRVGSDSAGRVAPTLQFLASSERMGTGDKPELPRPGDPDEHHELADVALVRPDAGCSRRQKAHLEVAEQAQ